MFHLLLFIALFFSSSAVYAEEAVKCHGAEPFWKAELTDKSIEFQFEEKQVLAVSEVKGAAGYVDSFVKVYMNDGKAVAVTIATTCNDSMSDFLYPWQVVLFTDQANFYGCCGEPLKQ